MLLWTVCTDASLRERLRLLVDSLDAPPRHVHFTTFEALCEALGAATALPAGLLVGECLVPEKRSNGRLGGRSPLASVRRHAPGLRVLLGVRGTGSGLLRALRTGADGFVRLDGPLEAALKGLRAALAGALWLSPEEADRLRHELTGTAATVRDPGSAVRLAPREREVLRLLAEGHSQPRIAERLGVALPTVSTHVQRIYHKLDVRTAPAAVYEGVRRGLLAL